MYYSNAYENCSVIGDVEVLGQVGDVAAAVRLAVSLVLRRGQGAPTDDAGRGGRGREAAAADESQGTPANETMGNRRAQDITY